MPAVRVRMKPVTGKEPFVRKALQAKVDIGVTAAKRLAPKDTGALAASIGGRVAAGRGALVGILEATAPHALFVHNGTGLYGPRRALIFPKRAKVMRFTTKGGDVVYTRFTRGQSAKPFLVDALRIVANPNLQAVSGYSRGSSSVQSYIRKRPGA